MERGAVAAEPFWLTNSRAGRHRRRSSSFFFSSGFFVFILIATAIFLLFFAVPAAISFMSLKPNLVKKTWGSLNFVLVLFAVICGFLSKASDDTESTPSKRRSTSDSTVHKLNRTSTASPKWYSFSDEATSKLVTPNQLIRRNSFSYPDLQHQSWLTESEHCRFLDDMRMNHDTHRRSEGIPPPFPNDDGGSNNNNVSLSVEESRMKMIPSPYHRSPSLHPTLPQVHRNADPSTENSSSPPETETALRKRQNEKKRRGSSSTKEFISSMYPQRSKKKKSSDNFSYSDHPSGSSDELQPPSTEIILNFRSSPLSGHLIASRKGKDKKIKRISLESKRMISDEGGTPLKTKRSFDSEEENIQSDDSSPGRWIAKEHPPPPPPFSVPGWKFVTQGDFVRVLSYHSSRSASPDPSPRSCPSPDVDTKADSFIEMFRAGLRLEKMNSDIEKQRRRPSLLGRGQHSTLQSNPIPKS